MLDDNKKDDQKENEYVINEIISPIFGLDYKDKVILKTKEIVSEEKSETEFVSALGPIKKDESVDLIEENKKLEEKDLSELFFEDECQDETFNILDISDNTQVQQVSSSNVDVNLTIENGENLTSNLSVVTDGTLDINVGISNYQNQDDKNEGLEIEEDVLETKNEKSNQNKINEESNKKRSSVTLSQIADNLFEENEIKNADIINNEKSSVTISQIVDNLFGDED